VKIVFRHVENETLLGRSFFRLAVVFSALRNDGCKLLIFKDKKYVLYKT